MDRGDHGRLEWLVKHAPQMREEDLEQLNGLYPAYLFRRRRTGEVWTTCCGHHVRVQRDGPDEQSAAWAAVMQAPHHREPEPWDGFCCHVGAMSAPPPKPEPKPMACPICGRKAKVKELGRTGRRDNLAAWRRVVVLRVWEGALWAMAYQSKKVYGDELDLTARPQVELLRIYRFQPGLAERASRMFGGALWTGYSRMDAPPGKLPLPVTEPFTWCSAEGMSYALIHLDALEESDFRYCQLRTYLGTEARTPQAVDAMRYLALCTQWPRQVEMLVKLGMKQAVNDLITGKRWNKRAFDWAETDPRKAFDLSRPELRAWLAVGDNAGDRLDLAVWYKQLRRAGVTTTFPELEELRRKIPFTMRRVVGKMARYGVTPRRLGAYIRKEMGRKGQKKMGAAALLTEWVDYLEDAALLGYDLKNPVWLTPRQLHTKHMDTMEPAGIIRAGKKAAKYRSRQKALTRRYTFSTDRWLIRPPATAREIVEEGKALCHCVGGYADRHMRGRTTILFLRDRLRPGKPLVTIEMNGNEIAQIHGYRNDDQARISPRVRYSDILEPWLAWLAAGSRRDKTGRPVIRTEKKGEVA